jgi:antitoxin component YwqK of YwqJK toxin-antitoxin module
MNKLVKYLVLFALVFGVAACKRGKPTPVVRESYADGNPKILTEYLTDQYGRKRLYKETYFFPGEKKHVEGKYDEQQTRDGIWTSWYENGNKNSEVKYINRKEHGKYQVWHPNGKIYIKGKYDMRNKIGVWEIYDSLGVKTRDMNFFK